MTPEQFEALCEGHQRFNGSGDQGTKRRSFLDVLKSGSKKRGVSDSGQG